MESPSPFTGAGAPPQICLILEQLLCLEPGEKRYVHPGGSLRNGKKQGKKIKIFSGIAGNFSKAPPGFPFLFIIAAHSGQGNGHPKKMSEIVDFVTAPAIDPSTASCCSKNVQLQAQKCAFFVIVYSTLPLPMLKHTKNPCTFQLKCTGISLFFSWRSPSRPGRFSAVPAAR